MPAYASNPFGSLGYLVVLCACSLRVFRVAMHVRYAGVMETGVLAGDGHSVDDLYSMWSCLSSSCRLYV